MGLIKFGILALAALAVTVDAKKKKEKAADAVLNLDDSNFDTTIAEHENLLVAFVAPWCGHCKKLKPEYAKAAKVLQPEGIHLAQVDATVAKDLASRFDVSGFPTLKFFKNGVASEYNGGRDQDAIVSWMRKKAGPLMTKIATAAEADSFEEKAESVVICFAEEGSESAKKCETAAAKSDDVPFAITNAAELRTKYNLPATDAAIVSVNKFEDQDNVVVFRTPVEEWTADEIAKWAGASSMPLVVTFSQDNSQKIFRGELKTHFLLFADNEGEGADALKQYREAAKGSNGRALFVNVPSSEERVVSYFGLSKDDMPTAVLVNMADGGMKKYKFTKAMKSAEFLTFLDDYSEGKLKPFLKSEPAPDAAENAAANVKTVTGSNFEALIGEGKDLLLEVYAPWCGHCKQLAPIYETLGKAVKAAGYDKTLTIAKMDGTTNEIDFPGVTVRGYPTIVFIPAGASAAKEYDGGRDVQGFATYLAKNAKGVEGSVLEDAAEAAGDSEEDEE